MKCERDQMLVCADVCGRRAGSKVAVDYGVVQPKLRSWLYSLHQVFPEFFLGHVQLARIPIGGG